MQWYQENFYDQTVLKRL